jgi:hypothetical protein
MIKMVSDKVQSWIFGSIKEQPEEDLKQIAQGPSVKTYP